MFGKISEFFCGNRCKSPLRLLSIVEDRDSGMSVTGCFGRMVSWGQEKRGFAENLFFKSLISYVLILGRSFFVINK